jgi:hypothetical protein
LLIILISELNWGLSRGTIHTSLKDELWII